MYEPSSNTDHRAPHSLDGGAIVVDGLTRDFGTRRVVDSVSFGVRAGEIFGVLGRNGSGKSTTVRMLTTLLAPTAGRATILGRDVVVDATAVRRSIGVTLQDATVDPNMTGRQHLRLIGRLLGHRTAHVAVRSDELLERFGLEQAASRPIRTYSGGMQRRLDLATALFDQPPVLFLDEPTTGLDPQSRRALWQQIHELRERGTTVFLTTQYLEEADQLADRIVVLDSGRIIAEGAPRDLKRRLGRRTVTIAGRHRLDSLGLSEGVTVTTTGDSTVIEGPSAMDVDVLLATVRDVTGHLRGLTVTEPTLEDVFIQLTGLDINTPTAGAATTREVAA